MLMENINVAFSVLMIAFMHGAHGECMADKLDLDLCCRQMKGAQISQIGRQGKHSGFRANWMVAEMAALALGTKQLHSFALFCMESEADKICEGWAT
jgi:hypothetical protein